MLLPGFSGSSSALGASQAGSVTNQIKAFQVNSTGVPRLSSSLGPLSSQVVNAKNLTVPTSLPRSKDLSSSLGALRPFRKEDFKNTTSQVISTGVPGPSSVSNLTTRASERLRGFSTFISSWKPQSSLAAVIATSSAIPVASASSQSSISNSVQASLASDSVQRTASMSNTLASQSSTRHSAANQTASFSQSSASETMYSSAAAQQSNFVSSLQAQSTFHAKQFHVLGASLKSSTEAIPTAVSAKSSSLIKASTSIQGESSIISSSSLAMQSESSRATTKSLPLSSPLAIQSLASASAQDNIPGQSYTVVPGDSMWLIAQKYGAPYDALIVFNPQIPDPNQITPGQVLKVPATHMEDPSVYTSPSTGGSSSSPNTDASSSGQQKDGSAYTVKTGDSLWKIAQQFGVTIEEISAANPSMKDKDFVYPGQLVNIPV
jgi:LysM repeat protein